MRVNWRKFAITFALLNVALILCGCGSWVGAIQGLMPAIEAAITAIFSFIGALEGKTVPASVTDFVNKIEADVSTELQNVSTILSEITANASATVLQQVQGAFQAIVSNLNSILSGLNVTDTSTIGKITSLVGLAIAAVEAVLGLIPLAMRSEELSDEEKLHADKAASTSIQNTHKILRSAYHEVVSTSTDNADVNTALAALPQTLP